MPDPGRVVPFAAVIYSQILDAGAPTPPLPTDRWDGITDYAKARALFESDDPYAYEIHEYPYPTYKRLRDEAPAYENPQLGFYALSRFHDVWNAIQEWDTFSSAEGVSLERGSARR